VVEHTEEEEFYVFMTRNKDSGNGKVDWYNDSRATIHFIHNADLYVNFVENKSYSDYVVLSCEEEYRLRGKRNVLL
jgi:hypothetical protein